MFLGLTLLPDESDRVLLIYVSMNRNDVSWGWLFDQVRNAGGGKLQGFLCDLGGNGILFLSHRGNDRLRFMRGTLRCVFGPMAEWRLKSLS